MEFVLDPANPTVVQSITYELLEELHDMALEGHDTDSWRFSVYSKHGVADVCVEGCTSSTDGPRECKSLSLAVGEDPAVNILDDPAVYGEEFFYGVTGDTIAVAGESDYHNSGLGNDMLTGVAGGFEILEDHGGKDTIDAAGGNDLVISRSGGDIITLGGDGVDNISTVRVYPTHEKDHLFGWKDQGDLVQCTKITDVWEETTIELVMDDLWYPEHKFTNEDDFCAVMVHGWELEWYWAADGWAPNAGGNKVDIWYSRSTGAADLCLSTSASDCTGPEGSLPSDAVLAPFCITYWVKCEEKPVSVPSTVEEDLLADAWSSWFGW
jgi:hypothetical protein